MADFKLSGIIEYLQIRERRRSVNAAISGSSNLISSICSAAQLVIKTMPNETLPISNLIDGANENTLVSKKYTIYNSILNSSSLEKALADFNSRLLKDAYAVFAASSYSFAESIFQIECDLDELKKYRTGGSPNEDTKIRTARIIRRKAEESYHGGQIDEAIRIFKESDEKYGLDYCTHYQLGFIYFFEKGDYEEALTSFKRAARYSQNKSNVIFSDSMSFVSMLQRIMADRTHDGNLAEEAHRTASEAYNANIKNNMALYALAQSTIFLKTRAGHLDEGMGLLKELVRRDRLFAMQIIFDRAFDEYIDEIQELFNELSNEITAKINGVVKLIDEALERLMHDSKYLMIPAKASQIRLEFVSIQEKLKSRVFFELSETLETANTLYSAIQELFIEIEKNKNYYDARDLIEKIITEYNEEAKIAIKPFKELEESYNAVRTQLSELNKTYPDEESHKLQQQNDAVNEKSGKENIEKPLPAGGVQNWKESRLFSLIKTMSGCLGATILVASLFCSLLLIGFETNIITILACIIVAAMAPIYGAIGAEAYYIYIESKRKKIHNKFSNLAQAFENKKPLIDEMEKKLRERYAAMISDKAPIMAGTSFQVFDYCLRGNYEKIKNFIVRKQEE